MAKVPGDLHILRKLGHQYENKVKYGQKFG